MRGPGAIITEAMVWLALAAAAFALTFQFNEPLEQYRYGAAGWPRAIILAIVLFALLQMIAKLREFYRDQGGAQSDDSPAVAAATPATGFLVNLKRVGTFGLPLAYLLFVPKMGYYIVTPPFIAGYMALLGERRWTRLIGAPLLIFVLTLFIFTELLFVPLPVGNWPGFYEVNSLFLALIK